ncbi:MAG: ATP-binding cassette domain-containing protein [Oscillospiraceae bacterium]
MRLRDMAAPPGFDSAHEIKRVRNWLISCVAIFVFLFACVYVGRLTVVYNSMRNGGRFESMGLFPEVARSPSLVCFLPVFIGLLAMLIRNINFAPRNYYTMRRLPDRWEYPLRYALASGIRLLVLLVVSQLLLLLAGQPISSSRHLAARRSRRRSLRLGGLCMIEPKRQQKLRHQAVGTSASRLRQIVGLFGENGAGKHAHKVHSRPAQVRGTITLDSEPISRKNIDRLSFATASTPSSLSPDGRGLLRQRCASTAKRFDVLMDFFELPRKGAPSKLSTGQKNQFEVVLALSQGADYILMDEPFSGNDVFNREDFYKVLLGIMEPNETVILSTHLIEEVEGFIGRALLIHKGRLVGDVQMSELEETGEGLIDFVKRNYGYRAERIRKAISELSGDE